MDWGERSLSTFSVDMGALADPSCCFRNASMKGVRVRMAVSSWKTPSVCRRELVENDLMDRMTGWDLNMRRGLGINLEVMMAAIDWK